MAAEYKVIVKEPTGAKLAEVVDYLSLTYARRVNEAGLCRFILRGNYDVVSQIVDKAQVEVWRRNADDGIAWYCDFYGLYRKQEREYRDSEHFIATCPGQMSMLGWRHILWYAATSNRSSFSAVAAETVLKTLVEYNVGASATAGNSRLRTGTLLYPGTIGVETDGGRGNSITVGCAYSNLLRTLQKICGDYAGGDYDLVRTSDITWEFRFYPGQLGTDRSDTVTFALEYGNMANPVYTKDRINEATVCAVGGQGLDSSRSVRLRYSSIYDSANDIETFADGRQYTTTAALDSMGDAVLDAVKARDEFDYDVIQTAACRYGRDYFLGDLVTANWGTVNATQQIRGVTVSFRNDGNENIDIETRTL